MKKEENPVQKLVNLIYIVLFIGIIYGIGSWAITGIGNYLKDGFTSYGVVNEDRCVTVTHIDDSSEKYYKHFICDIYGTCLHVNMFSNESCEVFYR